MKRLALATVSLLALTRAHAQVGPSALPPGPLPVRPECSVPPLLTSTFAHTWYFDPVNGQPPNYLYTAGKPDQIIMAPIVVPTGQTMKAFIATLTNGVWSSPLLTFTAGQTIPMGGNGSQAVPWNNLSALSWNDNNQKQPYHYPLVTSVLTYQYVAAANGVPAHYAWLNAASGGAQQSGPIAPGDEILLMSGNYGGAGINNPGLVVDNGGRWITVAAAPGQHPTIATLSMGDTNGWLFDGIQIRGGISGIMISDGGGANGLVTHDLAFTHLDLSTVDDSVSATWTQAQWVALAKSGFSGNGTNYGANTYCIDILANHSHNTYEGPSFTFWHSTYAYNESDRFLDNSGGVSGSYNDVFNNFSHDPVDSGGGLHVDGYQQEGYPLQGTDTSETFTQLHIKGNLMIDRFDPTAPFPTKAMTMFDDYSGRGYLIFDHMTIENNVMISSGTCVLYNNNIQFSVVRNNTCVPALPTQYPYPAINVGGGNSHDDEVFNNISTEIDFSSGVNMNLHDNVVVRFSAAGGTANQVVTMAGLYGLFNQAPNGAIPPVYDLTLKPGATTNGTLVNGPATNFLGQPWPGVMVVPAPPRPGAF